MADTIDLTFCIADMFVAHPAPPDTFQDARRISYWSSKMSIDYWNLDIEWWIETKTADPQFWGA